MTLKGSGVTGVHPGGPPLAPRRFMPVVVVPRAAHDLERATARAGCFGLALRIVLVLPGFLDLGVLRDSLKELRAASHTSRAITACVVSALPRSCRGE